jgi:DNA (cytosine-5)-methyltransferase 1/DNA (cytosine-5)-methyltransferase 3A
MRVLSLFDGMSCGQIALNRIGIKPKKYYAAEIDKYAIKVTQANYPDTIQLGSVTEWQEWDINWSSIDLVTGGFPCQAWSMAGKQLGDKDERGMLFWVMLDIMKQVKQHNPKVKFLIENVKMKVEFEEYITYHTEQALGEVCKTLINSALVSAQNRNRYYWTNWHVEQPEDKGIVLADIIESGFYSTREKSYCLDANYGKGSNFRRFFFCGSRQIVLKLGYRIPSYIEKNNANKIMHGSKNQWRLLSVVECEKIQTVPVLYVERVAIPKFHKYKMLGNGWTVDVIAHILKQMNQPIKQKQQAGLF